MRVCGIEFEEKIIDGKYCLQPKERLEVRKFQEVLKDVKAHGGIYSRLNGFVFNDKPVFDAKLPEEKIVELQKEKVVELPKEEPVAEVVTAEVVEEKRELKELDKLENKIKEEDVPKGTEFEVKVSVEADTCMRHFDDLMTEEQYKSPDHQTMLEMLKERCKEDAEFRGCALNKEYSEMLSQGAYLWFKAKKKKGNSCVCTADDIYEYVVKAYKEGEKK